MRQRFHLTCLSSVSRVFAVKTRQGWKFNDDNDNMTLNFVSNNNQHPDRGQSYNQYFLVDAMIETPAEDKIIKFHVT